MNDEEMKVLAKVRYDKAEEIFSDAEDLLEMGSYTSANNRAFYAAEKAIKAALVSIGTDVASHNGAVRMFNQEFIHNPSQYFTHDDLRQLQGIERIRNASDYDDFYLASKEECRETVKKAREIMDKVKVYLQDKDILDK